MKTFKSLRKRYPENRPLEINRGSRSRLCDRHGRVPVVILFGVGAVYKSSEVYVSASSRAAAEKKAREMLDVTPEQWARAKARWEKRRVLAEKRQGLAAKKYVPIHTALGQPKKRTWSAGGTAVLVRVTGKDLDLCRERLAEVLDALGGARAPRKLSKKKIGKLLMRNDR